MSISSAPPSTSPVAITNNNTTSSQSIPTGTFHGMVVTQHNTPTPVPTREALLKTYSLNDEQLKRINTFIANYALNASKAPKLQFSSISVVKSPGSADFQLLLSDRTGKNQLHIDPKKLTPEQQAELRNEYQKITGRASISQPSAITQTAAISHAENKSPQLQSPSMKQLTEDLNKLFTSLKTQANSQNTTSTTPYTSLMSIADKYAHFEEGEINKAVQEALNSVFENTENKNVDIEKRNQMIDWCLKNPFVENGVENTFQEAFQSALTAQREIDPNKQRRMETLEKSFKELFIELREIEISDEEIDDLLLQGNVALPSGGAENGTATTATDDENPRLEGQQFVAEEPPELGILGNIIKNCADLSEAEITTVLQKTLNEVFEGDSNIEKKPQAIAWALEDLGKLSMADDQPSVKNLQSALEHIGQKTTETSDPTSALGDQVDKTDANEKIDAAKNEEPPAPSEGSVTGRMWSNIGSMSAPARYVVGFFAVFATLFTAIFDILYGGSKWLNNGGNAPEKK